MRVMILGEHPIALKGSGTYPQLIHHAKEHGWIEESRAGRTWNIPPIQFHYNPAETVSTARFNPALGFVEACQILNGHTWRDAIAAVAPKTFGAGFFDRSNVEYGERIGKQIPQALRELKESPTSRRSAMVASNYLDEESPDERPCAMAVQARIHHGKLGLLVVMRSWDLVRGLPYNLMMWGIPLQIMASLLKVKVGEVTIWASTPHVYEEDFLPDLNPQRGPIIKVTDTYPEWWNWMRRAELELREAPWCGDCKTTSWHRRPSFVEVIDAVPQV